MNRTSAALVLAALAAPLAGCASPLVVDAAPYAADPDCARVMLAVPEVVGGLDMRATSSQATSAWGEDNALVMRCGVEPPDPPRRRVSRSRRRETPSTGSCSRRTMRGAR
ncbi:hypothetical protein GCM10025873_03020 [Demequina sediminis]|uniref:DUF3515 family protein n=1 Tax=Demequina sediminis TaxID=1930058 RepID=UPI003D9B66E8|nr:hypothetical protein GCM10025873_03020 [Demequina sediminis]